MALGTTPQRKKTTQQLLFDELEPPRAEEPEPDMSIHHAIVLEWGLQRRALGLPEVPDPIGLRLLKLCLDKCKLTPERAARGVKAFFNDSWTMSHCGCSLAVMCHPARWDRFFVQELRRPWLGKTGQFLSDQSAFESDEAFWGET